MTSDSGRCGCERFDGWLTPYADGELDAVHTAELEAHLAECELCMESVAFTRAMRSSLRRMCVTPTPAMLRERVRAAVETELEAAEPRGRGVAGRRGSWGSESVWRRYGMPLAAAAALAAILVGAFGVRDDRSGTEGSREARSTVEATMTSLDSLLEDLVSQHVEPLPLEEPDSQHLQNYERFVGVRVPKPELRPLGGRFVGGRVQQPGRDKRAAMLRLVVRDKHPVTVYVFDPRRVPMAPHIVSLNRRHIKPRDVTVYTGRMRGYSVAASERNGVGYALATDLSDEESTQLVLALAD